jgi:hypothetical protein
VAESAESVLLAPLVGLGVLAIDGTMTTVPDQTLSDGLFAGSALVAILGPLVSALADRLARSHSPGRDHGS